MNVFPQKIFEISQAEADQWLRKLFTSETQIARDAILSFSDEQGRRERGQDVWALPEADRTYFTVNVGAASVLLAGVNQNCSLSSFMKVDWSENYRGVGKLCVRMLIESELVRLCKERGIKAFSVHTATERSWKIFHTFINNLPMGIEQIEQTTAGFTLYI